jgi:hypothetical protein
MKPDVMLWIIVAMVACFAIWVMLETSDEIVFEYDPTTGKQKVTAHKNRRLETAAPLILEGE